MLRIEFVGLSYFIQFNIFFCLSCFSSLDPYVDSHLSWFCFSMVGVERIGWAYLKVQ